MNTTHPSASTQPRLQGWTSSPNQRGTFEILSSCLTLIIACTWTILHLNVPAYTDQWYTKALRKAKWMVVTIIFPEFIFAHAMEERSMAAEALDNLRAAGYEPKFQRRWWHNVIDAVGAFKRRRYWGTASQLETATSKFSKKECHWTYTHAFFADMGGFYVMKQNGDTRHPRLSPDAYSIVMLYINGIIDEMPEISEEEIKDKGKADWLLKSFVLAQFSWLAMSLTARKFENLPSSPLEIVTVAFTCCGAMTSAAAWHKPKDVNTPVKLELNLGLEMNVGSRNKSFFSKLWFYKGGFNLDRRCNDNLSYTVDRNRPMIGWMMLGTIVFAGFHCLAWNFEFPTPIERLLWRISTLTASSAPLLLPLIVNETNNPYYSFLKSVPRNDGLKVGWAFRFSRYILLPLVCLIYILARLCVLSLALASLRAMPPDVYKTTWTRYIISIQ